MNERRMLSQAVLLSGLMICGLTMGGCPNGFSLGGDTSDNGSNRDAADCSGGTIASLPAAGVYLAVETEYNTQVIESSSALESLFLTASCDPNQDTDYIDFFSSGFQTLMEIGEGGAIAAIHTLFEQGSEMVYTTSHNTGGLRFVLDEGCLRQISDLYDPNEYSDLLSIYSDPNNLFGDPNGIGRCGEHAYEYTSLNPDDPNGGYATVCVRGELVSNCQECRFSGDAYELVASFRIHYTILESGTLQNYCGDRVAVNANDTLLADVEIVQRYRISGSPEAMGYRVTESSGLGGLYTPVTPTIDPNLYAQDPVTIDPNLYSINPGGFDPNDFAVVLDPNLFGGAF